MKIEIDIDIESIVREALKKKQSEEVVSIPVEATTTNSRSKWEYGRVSGRRRSTEELEMHAAEKKLGRKLTPEDKGEIKAKVHIDESTENKTKEAAIKKARIDTITAEGIAAANKELEEETSNDTEAKTPSAEPLNIPKSLFS